MDCPNCKKPADHVTIDQVDYINCPECGWFQVQADGSMNPCDPPSSNLDRPPEPGQSEKPAALEPEEKPAQSNVPEPTSEGGQPNHNKPPTPSDPDIVDESDETGIGIEIEFED